VRNPNGQSFNAVAQAHIFTFTDFATACQCDMHDFAVYKDAERASS